jgi:hypothetical protein
LDKELRVEKEKEDDFVINDEDIMNEIIDIPVGAVDGAVRSEQIEEDVIEDNEEDAFVKWLSTDFEWVIDYLENSGMSYLAHSLRIITYSLDMESWKCSGKMSFILDLVKDCVILKEKLVIVSHSIACLSE